MNQETLDKMRRMRLFGMQHAFKIGMETPHSEPYTARNDLDDNGK